MIPPTQRRNPTPSSIPLNDPRYPIWGRLFLCRVPRIAHYSTKYLEEFGLPSSGNKNIDRTMAQQLHLVYIPINQMVEYFHQSQVVAIVKQADVKTVYEICQDYTFNWAETLNKTLFQNQVPFADLIKIDEFAEAVYRHAGYEYGSDFARTFVPEGVMKEVIDINKMFESIDKRITEKNKKKVQDYEVRNIYSPDNRGDIEPEKVQETIQLPERPSMRELFESYMDPGNRA